MQTTCPNCQQLVNVGQQFCNHCGYHLQGKTKVEGAPTTPGQAVPTGAPAGQKTAPNDPLIGRTLDGKYELLGVLGAGGMGTVYRARRIHIGDEVAVKVLHAQFVAEQQAVERFRREARAAALLRHPNVVAIYDYGEARGPDFPAFIVMELVNGVSLRELLRRERKLAPARAVALMREICAGVGAAHRNNIVHRDLKPDNIIVIPPDGDERETVKVLDFGIAKLRDLSPEQNLTQTGAVLGTPYYMSPEQCRGDALDARADVYSLGAMLYEMLAGQPPFTAATITGVVAKHLTEPPPPLFTVPQLLGAAVLRSLAKEAPARQTDAAAFARELQNALAAPPGQTYSTKPALPLQATEYVLPPTAPTFRVPDAQYPVPENVRTPQFGAPAASSSSRTGLLIGVAALALFVLVAGAAAVWLLSRDDEPKVSSTGLTKNASPQVTATPTPAPTLAATPAPTIAATVGGGETAGAVNISRIESAEALVANGQPLAEKDLAGLGAAELRVLRNTVFARHGRVFETPDLQRHFTNRSWYKPNPDFNEEQLTDADRVNVQLLVDAGRKLRAAATASMQASSVSQDSYGPEKARDDRYDTGWVEGAGGPGKGEWLAFTFAPQTIQYVDIFPGYGKSRALFFANNRVRRVTLIFGDGARTVAELFDEMRLQTIALAAPVRTGSLRVIVEDVYPGTKYDDTVISEINWR